MLSFEEKIGKVINSVGCSEEDAIIALNAADGDVLDAIIMLENQSAAAAAPPPEEPKKKHAKAASGGDEEAKNVFLKIGNGILKAIGVLNSNTMDVWYKGRKLLSTPLSVLLLLALFMFWWTLAFIVLSLILGWRYKFSGPQINSEKVNVATDAVSDAADKAAEKIQDQVRKHQEWVAYCKANENKTAGANTSADAGGGDEE